MIAIIFLSNLIVLALISFSLKYIYNNCNNTYVHLIEQPVETIAQLESPFFFKCLGSGDKNDNELEVLSEED
jgi:hypothetical protein